MAVSKRTRYEVLRRDNFTCRYCGGKSPNVELHVDHVTPVALGGSDKPDNLVDACVDCNRGKASTSPDAKTVDDVAEDALRWRAAMNLAAAMSTDRTPEEDNVLDEFYAAWDIWTTHGGTRSVPLSLNWQETVLNYWRSGLPSEQIIWSVNRAMERKSVVAEVKFQYFCGIARNKLSDLTEIAAHLIESGEV